MGEKTATKEQAKKVAREVYGYKDPERWNPHGTNTVDLWQADESDEGFMSGHWYINRQCAHGDPSYIRLGRTVQQMQRHYESIFYTARQ